MLLGRCRGWEGLLPVARNRSHIQWKSDKRMMIMAGRGNAKTLAAAAAMMGDDWDFTAEEMDSIERNAAQELAARRHLAVASSPLKMSPQLLTRAMEHQGRASSSDHPPSPVIKRRIRVKFSKEVGKIAVEAPYNLSLLGAYKSVSGHEWDPARKLWFFPEQQLEDVTRAVITIPELDVEIQTTPPLMLPPGVSYPVLTPQNSPAKSQDRPGSAPSTPSKEIVVQIYMLDGDRIAVRSPYNQRVKECCQSMPGKAWNSDEKIWSFPREHLNSFLRAIQAPTYPPLKIEIIPPLAAPEIQPSEAASVAVPVPPQESFSPAASSKEKNPISNPVRLSVKLFLHSCGYIAIKCQPSPKLIAALRSFSKAIWNPKESLWMFPPRYLKEAEAMLAAVEDVASVESLEPIVRRALEIQNNSPDYSVNYENIPSHLEANLRPFQRDGVKFALQHGAKVLIADEMGLGKTVQGIALASCFRDAWPVLVIVPSSLRLHWATMLATWLKLRPSDITVVLTQGGGGSNRGGFSVTQSAGKTSLELRGLFNIISYDLITKLSPDSQFKVVIADESHFIKNANAKRTMACVPLIQRSQYAFLLTGTPALSRPIELFKQLEALQPSVYTNVHEYGKRYCTGSHFGVYQGASNHEELHALLKSTVMIRRLKREVLGQLPEKTREQVFLSVDMESSRELRALIKELHHLREAMQTSPSAQVDELKREERTLINKIYGDSATVKVPAVQDYLSTMLEANCKFLVFAHHHTMMDGIEAHLKKKKVEYIRIDGETPQLARHNLITKFQESDHVRAAVLSIRAAGLGLTLTAASTVIFAEMSWTPGDLVQAEDRAHRMGQRSCVNVYYLHAQDTIDDFIWDSIHNKLQNLGQVLNGREETLNAISPSRLRQGNLNSYLRPCTRNLSEQFDRDTAAAERDAKRPKLGPSQD